MMDFKNYRLKLTNEVWHDGTTFVAKNHETKMFAFEKTAEKALNRLNRMLFIWAKHSNELGILEERWKELGVITYKKEVILDEV